MMAGLLALLGTLIMVTQVMAGIWTSNNFLYKPSEGARGAQEKAIFDSGLNRVDTRLGNEKWVNDPAYGGNFQGAVTAIGTNPTVLHIPPGTWPIASDLTIPANITLKLPRGAILNIANGKTLTLNGGVDGGLYQIFSCSGTGKVVFGLDAVQRILPEWWGAKGDNTTDSTAAIEAAWKACWVTPPEPYFMNYQNPVLFFSPGYYLYNGTGLTQQYTYANITVKGEGPGTTCITTNAGHYFIDVDYCDSVRISGINFRGGKGAFRQNGTAANVGGECIFENNWFYEYTECAVGFNTADKADIKIKNNFFYGNRIYNTIGIALSYTPDNSDITGNCFVCDNYHIKVPGAGTGGVFITRNEFIRWNSPDPTYDVWIVPGTTVNPGNVNIYSNKFGNEQLRDHDVRILIADEGAGTYNSDKHHAVTASTGIVNGMKIRDNAFYTTGTNTKPIIYSYTPNVYDMIFENQFYGSPTTSNIINFAAALDDYNPWNRMNNFSYKQVWSGIQNPVPDPSSDYGLGHVEDPHGYLEGRLGYPHFYPGAGTDPCYKKLLLADKITSDSGLYHSTKLDCADSVGGANATTVTFTASDGQLTLAVLNTSLEVGRSGFIEFDMKVAGANPLTAITVEAHPGVNFAQWIMRRVLKIPATWTRIRLPFTTRSTGNMILRFSPYGYAAGVTNVIVGRPAIYYAQEPVNLGAAPQVGLQILTAAPTNPYQGMMVIADRATWDPKSKGSGGPYPVWYNGSAWKLLSEQ